MAAKWWQQTPKQRYDQQHEKVTVDRKMRMWLNGESEGQMQHVEAIKKAGGVALDPKFGNDTSRDQDWEYDDSRGAKNADMYVLVTTLIWMGIKLIVFALPTLLANLLPLIVAHTYTCVAKYGTERFHRSFLFYVAFTIALVLSTPACLVILASLILDYTMYYVFSILYCAITFRWKRVCASWEKIRPYNNGPWLILHLPDLFVCVLGQCCRQTVGETWYMVSTMWILIPWLKYYVCCNPWIYDLDHRLCQQISTHMADLGSSSDVADTCRGIISRAKQPREIAERLDIWSFVPHYPYPPPFKRWALGLQAGGGSYPGKFTLIVHTTHAISNAGGSTEQFVLSNSCKEPIYRVMLWYSNPFHFLTGWVEASVSTGMPSQPTKDAGGEHPMWLVTGRTPQTSGRESFTGSGMIDAFFDYWLPVFVHEMRRQTFAVRFSNDPDGDEKALRIANDKYQEVCSQDGVSTPRRTKGRENYSNRDALTQFQMVGKKQGVMKKIDSKLKDLKEKVADTGLGQMLHNKQQSEEVELTPLSFTNNSSGPPRFDQSDT